MKALISLFLLFFSLNVLAIDGNIQKLSNVDFPEEIPFFDESSEKIFLDNFENKTVLLVFWATWCSHCIQEIPELDLLQKDFRKLPFEVVAVSQDFNGIEPVKEYFKNQEIRHLKIYHDPKNILFKAFGVVGLPTAFLITSDGKIAVKFTGNINWYDDKVRETLLEHIPGSYSAPKNSRKLQLLNATKPKSKESPK